MNEALFFLQTAVLIGFVLLALRLGKAALFSAFILQLVLANLFIIKQIHLFGLNVTATDVYTIGSLFTLSCMQEYYGRAAARKAVWGGFLALAFLGIMAQFHLFFRESPYDTSHHAYTTILSHTPRVLLSSFVVAFVADRIDISLYSWMRKKGWSIASRFGCASLLSQLLDTALFTFAALYGTVHSIGEIIAFSFALKAICIFCMTPFIPLTRRVVRAV